MVVASDMYCIDPACDCGMFHVAFSAAIEHEGDEGEGIGAVSVTFAGKVGFAPTNPDREARLRALWARYRQRHPTLRVQAERYEEMRAFGAEHLASSPPVAVPASSVAARAWVSPSRKRRSRART